MRIKAIVITITIRTLTITLTITNRNMTPKIKIGKNDRYDKGYNDIYEKKIIIIHHHCHLIMPVGRTIVGRFFLSDIISINEIHVA